MRGTGNKHVTLLWRVGRAFVSKGAITSKIKHAVKLKTSPAWRTVRRHWLQAKTKCQWGLQQLCKSCTTCFMFYCMFYFTCDRSLTLARIHVSLSPVAHNKRFNYSAVSANECKPRSATCSANSLIILLSPLKCEHNDSLERKQSACLIDNGHKIK